VPVAKLKAFLDLNNVPYIQISHSKAYTAQAIAALAHVPGRELAKTVIVRVNGRLAMAVLPASFQVDLQKLKTEAGAMEVQLATEYEFEESFPDCEVGAMPPFGNLYGMPVYVDESLTRDEEVAFNAGSHRELIRVAYPDFERLVHPVVLKFCRRASASAA
jgi:Ala-tRNA(Pro) deacylase